jgi:hypothetical protein
MLLLLKDPQREDLVAILKTPVRISQKQAQITQTKSATKSAIFPCRPMDHKAG